jgi:hypothetical protein
MKKQTAVEFLGHELNVKLFYDISPELWEQVNKIFKQALEMEKEQIIEFAEFVATYTDKNKNVNGDMLHAKSKYDGAERTIDLLEQYYNL